MNGRPMADTDPILPKDGIKGTSNTDEGSDKSQVSYGSQTKPSDEKNTTDSASTPEAPTKKPPKKFRSNRYATKKTAGQGLLGVSLITSNTAQLKTTLDKGADAKYYMLILILLCVSLFLQVIVGVLLMIIGSRESKLDAEAGKGTKKTERLNDVSTLFMFLITMLYAALGTFIIDPGS